VLTDTDPAAQVVLIGEDDNVPQVLLDAANNAVACFRFSGRVLGVTMLVKGWEGRHALVCLVGRGGACCGGDSRR
jgi:hypothetical protein